MLKSVVVLVVLALIMVDRGNASEPPPPPASVVQLAAAQATGVVCDRFDLTAELAGRLLTVAIDTDLPDATVLMVYVSRSYFAGNPLETYPVEYFSERTTVGAWRKARVITIDNGAWRRTLDERLRILESAGEPLRVARISDELQVGFTVPVNQMDPRFGRRNEYLRAARLVHRVTGSA